MRIIAGIMAVLVICWLTLDALFFIARPPQVPDRVDQRAMDAAILRHAKEAAR